MKGALAALLLVAAAIGVVVVVSGRTAEPSAEEVAAESGLAWERDLPTRTGLTDESRVEPRFGRLARRLGAKRSEVRCWSERDWSIVAAEWQAMYPSQHDAGAVVVGFAEPDDGRIQLSPYVCEPLARFVYGSYAPFGNTGSLELAEALASFVHEAEHLRDPAAPEARVECLAMQRVRRLVIDSGRSASYAAEMAALAYEISYPRLPPEYRTRRCRNGGPLDQHPHSRLWP